MKSTPLALAVALVLAGCTSPPQAPTVDDSVRRPVNNSQALSLQRCTGELEAAKVELTEVIHTANRAATSAKAAALASAQACQGTAAAAAKVSMGAPRANQVFIVPFANGSAAWALAPQDTKKLSDAASQAELIVVRGRTNASSDSLAETALARRRAASAAAWLVKSGVPMERVRLQWQGSGDGLQGIQASDGAQRRVEIELYAAAPRVETLGASAL